VPPVTARRLIATAIVLALALAAVGSAGAGAEQRAPHAVASLANCNGQAFSPTQSGKVLTAKGRLTCTGDVAKQRLRVCLEQQRGGDYVTVECETRTRFGPGQVTIAVRHICASSVTRSFRTRSFLFLRDVSGATAHGKAVSDQRVYPRLCR
jgi:hypothetical protein